MALGGFGSGIVGGGLLAGTARVDVRPDLSTFGPRLRTELTGIIRSVGAFKFDAFDKSLAGIGASSAKLGGLLTKGLTVPIAGAGAVAFKFGADFESILTRMVNLAGVGANEIDGIRQAILAMSHETGRGPAELAEALYEIRSSGQVGQAALDALNVSAKAAALGLGDTRTVADAVTSAMNAYAESGLTAAQAGDILAASVREGKGSASEIATAIGRVIPIAAQMGVKFEDVGAALATMTLSGLDADEATTALRGILGTLLNPASGASKVLEEMGLNAQELRSQLRDQGLLAVLRTLSEHMGGNEEAIAGVIGNVRALTGFLNLTGQDAEKVDGIFSRLHKTTGTLDDGFSRLQKDAKFKLQRAFADAQVALVSFGEAIAPTGAKLADFASTAFEKFSELPDSVKTGTVAVGGLLAAIGPVTFVGGKLVSSLGKVAGAVKGSATAFSSFRLGLRGIETGLGNTATNKMGSFVNRIGGMKTVLVGTAGALVIAGVALELWSRQNEEARKRVADFTKALELDSGALGVHTRAYLKDQLAQQGLLDDLGRLQPFLSSGRNAFDVFTDAVSGNVDAQKEFAFALAVTGQQKGLPLTKLALEYKRMTGASRDAKEQVNATTTATRTAADVDRDLASAKEHLADLVAAHSTDEKALGDAHKRVSDLTAERKRIDDALAGSETKLDQTEEKHVTTLEKMVDKEAELLKARIAADDAVQAFKDAEETLAQARADAAGTGEKAVAAADAEQDALRSLAQASERVSDSQDKLAEATQGVVDAQVDLAEARRDLADLDSGPNKRIATLERQQIFDREITTDDEARQKEIDLLKFDQDAAEDRKSAQEKVADAQKGVEDAVKRVGDAERSLRDDVRSVGEAQGTVAEAAQARRQVQVDALNQIERDEREVAAAMFDAIAAFNQAKEDKTPLEPWLNALREIEARLDPNSPLRQNLDALLAMSAPAVSPWFASNGQQLTGRGSFAPSSGMSSADALQIYSGLNPEALEQAETTATPLSQADIIAIIQNHIGPGDSRLTAEQIEFLRKLGVPMFGTGGIADWPMGQPRLSVLHGQEQVTRPGQVIGADRPHVTVNAPITVTNSDVAGQVQVELRKQAIRLANVGVRG